MIETLRHEWAPGMTWDQLVALRDALDQALQQLRTTEGILPPMMNCPSCGKRHRAAPPTVSVRAMILAVGRFEIAPSTEVAELEKRWKKHQKAERLDRYGKPEQASTHM
jgi:hypothetical protein